MFTMSCRTTASTLLTAALLISLFFLDHPVAHARHVKEPSIPTGDSSSMKKGPQQGINNRKLDVGKTKKVETVVVKGPNGQGSRVSFGSGSGNGGSLGVEAARRGGGPIPHPKKHN